MWSRHVARTYVVIEATTTRKEGRKKRRKEGCGLTTHVVIVARSHVACSHVARSHVVQTPSQNLCVHKW